LDTGTTLLQTSTSCIGNVPWSSLPNTSQIFSKCESKFEKKLLQVRTSVVRVVEIMATPFLVKISSDFPSI
jgi:hypothetical protein